MSDDDRAAPPKRRASHRPTRVAPPKQKHDPDPELSDLELDAPLPSRSRGPSESAAGSGEPAAAAEPGEREEPTSTRVWQRERPRARRASVVEPSAGSNEVRRAAQPERPSARPARRSHIAPGEAKRRVATAHAPAATAADEAVREAAGEHAQGAILVTGICGTLGKLVARELHRVDRVVGVDRRPFPDRPKDIVFHELDLRRKKTRDIFRTGDVRAVVHLGVLHDPRKSDRDRHTWNVVGFQKLLEYMAQYEVRKLVVLSSANVYGPQPENPQFLTEEAPLLGSQEFGAIRDLVELDMLAQSYFWRHPESETVILRPCHILGRVRNAPSNYLRLSRPITVLGFDPMIQVIHERDVVRAIVRALRPGVRGIFNIRGPGELPLSRILSRLGKRPTVLPGPIARITVDRLWRMRLASFPSPELDHVRYVCMVDDTRAREVLGFTPRYSLDETLEAIGAGL